MLATSWTTTWTTFGLIRWEIEGVCVDSGARLGNEEVTNQKGILDLQKSKEQHN